MNSIAEILLQLGRDQANARLRQGDIQAQLQTSRGNINAQTIGGITQTVTSLPANIMQYQQQQQKTQLGQQQLIGAQENNILGAAQISDLQRQQQGRQVLGAAIKQFSTLDDQGHPVSDHQKIADAVSQAGYPDQANSWLKMTTDNATNIDKLKSLTINQAKAQNETIGDLAYSAKTPEDFASALGMLASTPGGGLDEQTAHQLADQIATNPQAADALRAKYLPFSPKYQAQQAEMNKPMDVAEGGVVNTPARGLQGLPPLITGGAKPPTSPELDAAYQALFAKRSSGQPLTPAEQTQLDAYEARKTAGQAPATVQTNQGPMQLDRKTGVAAPIIGPDGKPVKAPLPASIQVQNIGAAQAAAAPLVDASRPDPLTANKVDSQTGMTPNAMYQGALEYALKGSMPSIGFGQSPRAMGIRSGVMNKAGAIASAAGVDLPTVQSEYKANSAALSKIIPIATMTAAAAGTATDNLDLALGQSDQVARSGAKLGNRYLQWAQGNLTPAKGLAQFELYIYTAAREYAKVTSGSAASTQGLTDSATAEASKLINAAQAPETFAAVVDGMKKDMANVTGNQTKQIAAVSNTLGNFFSALNGGGPISSTSAKPPTTPASTMIEAKDPQGNIHHAPAGTQLPAGWTLVK
jgi:hypothetical protein